MENLIQAQWSAIQYTEPGKVRSINEDSVLNLTAEDMWAVADGMGGHSAGDYASQMVVSKLSRYQKPLHRGSAVSELTKILAHCNRHLVEKAASEDAGIMGCTVAVLSMHQSSIVCTWSGDSRIYRLRAGKLQLLTRDHSYQSLSEDRDRNYFADELFGDGQLLTGAIGGSDELHVENSWYELQPGDQFLLCTDGLYKELSDENIELVLNENNNPQHALAKLVQQYNSEGARDNVGVVIVTSNKPG